MGGGAVNGMFWGIIGLVLGIAASIDNILLAGMQGLGIYQPQWQVCILIFIVALAVMMVMRVLGALLGWLTLIFSAVLLVHFVFPALGH